MRELPGGRLEVLTFKDGILAGVAHDLLLVMERFEIRTDGTRVEARFHPATLRVEAAVRDGNLDHTTLSQRDRDEIADNIKTKILHTDRFPEATYVASVVERGDHVRLAGVLALAGVSAPLDVNLAATAGAWSGTVELQPSTFGIAPFKAMLGAIKLRDRVMVHFEVPIISF